MIAKINKTGIISDTIQKFDGEKYLTPTDFGFDVTTDIPETLSNVIDAQALAETAALNAIEAKSNIEESVETIVEEATNEIQTVVSEIKEETLNAQSLAELAAVNAIETEQSIQARATEIATQAAEEATTLAVNAKNLAEVAAVNALEAERNVQARANEIVEEVTSQAVNAKNLSETAAVNALEAERNAQAIKEELDSFLIQGKNYDSMPLLMSHWDKAGLVSPAWVKADAYWLSGDQYISAYDKILEKFNNGDEDVMEGTYSAATPNTENPSKFLIDTTNRAFRLPFVSTERMIVKKIVDGKENCTIYSDGFCEQYGVSASGVSSSTVTFRVPFIDVNYTVSIIVTEETATDTGGIASGLMISNIAPESFRISQRTADIPYWSAKGMVAIIPPSQYTENVALYFKLGNVFVNEDQMDATAISNKVDEIRNAWADADYVVESYNDGTSWYRLYKSGWIEQGSEYVGTSSGFQTITILPMRDTNYWVSTQRCGTTGNTNSTSLAYQQAINLTTTSFQAYTNTTSPTSTSTFRWFVAGYSA